MTTQRRGDEATTSSNIVLRAPRAGDFGWVVHRHGALYAAEYGWDQTFESLVARVVADFIEHRDPRREAAWIAEIAGEPVGSVFCVKKDDRVAQLRLLLVEPGARGRGVGSRLVEQSIDFARRAGYEQMMLWTNHPLEDARRLYDRAGFQLREQKLFPQYGQADLLSQTMWLDL